MMKAKKLVTTILILAGGLISGLSAQQTPSVNFWTRMANDELAAKITDEMTDSELLSQTFMFGWADFFTNKTTKTGLELKTIPSLFIFILYEYHKLNHKVFF